MVRTPTTSQGNPNLNLGLTGYQQVNFQNKSSSIGHFKTILWMGNGKNMAVCFLQTGNTNDLFADVRGKPSFSFPRLRCAGKGADWWDEGEAADLHR